MNKKTSLSRSEKIMLAIYEMSAGKKVNLRFEDVVVAAFKKFPEDFHLRGYPSYPDSGDMVHKPLYDFRKKGYLEANNKVFSFTERGMAFARRLSDEVGGKKIESNGRMTRFAEQEISRIEKSEGFSLFAKGNTEKITDTDFYNYFSVTPRTSPNDFLGRMETVGGAIEELKKQKNISAERKIIGEYHKYLLSKFASIINHFKKK